MKNILITGASGMLGSNLCISMNNKNFYITGSYFSNTPLKKDINFVSMDIRNGSICQEVIKKIHPDIVIHCAALTNMDLCEKNQKLAYEVNTIGTKNILESINKDCHFIFISTDNVYNNGIRFNKENSKNNITNIYGNSKLKAEELIQMSKIKNTILRTNFFGWHQGGLNAGLLHFIYDNLRQNKKINLFHDVYFTPISIPLLIKGLVKIINNEIIGIYNYGGNERISKHKFGIAVADVFQLDKKLINNISINEFNFLAKRPKEMSMDSTKISNHVNVPNTVLEQIIELGLPN